MVLKLDTWQRMQLLLLMSGVNGDLRTINKALKLIDLFEFSKDEKEKINLQYTDTGVVWGDPTYKWEIEIKDENLVTFLKEKVQGKSDWPANKGVIDLCEQLGIPVE